MSGGNQELSPPRVSVPQAPVVVAGFREVLWLSPDGEIEALAPADARNRIEHETPMLCHARATARRLDMPVFPALDLLELFAFVRPARFCVPTPGGLAEVLGIDAPHRPADACVALATAARVLLEELGGETDAEARTVAEAMHRGGWLWAPAVIAELLGAAAEPRPEQADYAAAAAAAFAPRSQPDQPQAVLAEAGTGVGKTLGYIAPASLWAEKNRGSVWISTYTRNLQAQIAQELDRLYPGPALKQRRVVVRKGRENFLCLLNYEEALGAALMRPGKSLAQLGLIARWIAASDAGDLVAGDFPGWLAELIGFGRVNWLSDRRGECVHSACPQFHH